MKYECDLIKDLLPLYHDEVCSKESKNAVETHIQECEGCREYYSAINTSDVVEDVTYDEERERKKSKTLKRIKRGFIIIGIIIVLVVLLIVVVPLLPILFAIVYLVGGYYLTVPEVDTNVANYSQYFGENATENYGDPWGMDLTIFPSEIQDDMSVQDFIMVYYNPFDAQYLSYLVVSYEDDAYEQELKRLESYRSIEKWDYFGATGFAEQYNLVAMHARYNKGFVYALADGEGTIIYVELLPCRYFYDLDYEKYIPNEYLPIGFDARHGNAYQIERMEKIQSTQNE